jgi:predicted nucleic acid-binding protein
VRAAVTAFASWQPVVTSSVLVERAWHWMDQAGISYGDALIVAAAERSGARWLLSEDLEDGRDFAGLTAVNPFGPNPIRLP